MSFYDFVHFENLFEQFHLVLKSLVSVHFAPRIWCFRFLCAPQKEKKNDSTKLTRRGKNSLCIINISLLWTQWRKSILHTAKTFVQVCTSAKLPNRTTNNVIATENFLDYQWMESYTDKFTMHKTQFDFGFFGLPYTNDYDDSFICTRLLPAESTWNIFMLTYP